MQICRVVKQSDKAVREKKCERRQIKKKNPELKHLINQDWNI